jgi:dipeptidyl aminopeptidase/acylaminoacyl peptidase
MSSFGRLCRTSDGLVATVAASATSPAAVVTVDPESGQTTTVRRSQDHQLEPEWLSTAQPITYSTSGDAVSHALWYEPVHPDHEGPPDERPPLVVISHGGPTAAADASYDERVQFWTTRGIGVVDVDYRGSTGYGRDYRNQLRGAWGIADTDDCIAAACHLADEGLVDPDRLAIRGGSAGGYTTLCALTFHDVFDAGCSLYGVADVEGLARDTHKFESRYLDLLIGPYPEAAELYQQRSPIHHTDLLSTPMLILQGLEDAIVPPSQSEAMAAALAERGIPFAYIEFAGEQHGFRRAESIQRAAEAELAFYGRIFGFAPADDLPYLSIENLPDDQPPDDRPVYAQ